MENKIINPAPYNWVNNNRELLLKYQGEWIAHDTEKIIAHHKDFKEMIALANKVSKNFIIYSAHHEGRVRFFPIKFKTFQTHHWQPLYPINLIIGNKMMKENMLVDSGADFCLIPFDLGAELGLTLSLGEPLLTADGIGGSILYVLKKMFLEIDTIRLDVPVAWVQDKDCKDLIMGREVVFDNFDIEFKQSEETIIFKHRN